MDLDEAIKYFEEMVEIGETYEMNKGMLEEYRQLAEWLKELKAYKEKETCETCGHYKAYQHGADITTMDDECGGCCSWNSKWIPKTCGDAISRQAVLDVTWEEPSYTDALNVLTEVRDKVKVLPSVTPQQRTGRWIPVGYDGYADGNPVYDWWECSGCGWEHTGDEESLTAFCPNCGVKMEV